MKIRRISASLSDIYLMGNFSGVIKQIKKDNKWTRGNIVVATPEERVKNAILAQKIFPHFFPQAAALNNETYAREFIDSPALDKDPENLEKVIEKMSTFHSEGINKVKKEKNIKIHRFGNLWEKGYILFGDLLKIKKCAAVLTYNLGDAKASNLLSRSGYLSFDPEGFGIGDISEDISALIEGYQFERKMDMLEKTLKITRLKYRSLDENIAIKSLLALAAIRSLEIVGAGHPDDLYKESIELLKKFKNK